MQVHRRRVPERLRQDQPVDDDPDAPGLEGRDDRRRHRVDEVRLGRPAVRGQPRGRLLRRRARARASRPTPTRSKMLAHDTVFTNCAQTDDGDIWWEGMTARAAGAPDRLARQRLDPGVRDARRPPERSLHGRDRPVPVDRARVGRPRGRADRRDAVRRPPRRPSCRSCYEARDWEHGVFLGSIMSSEKTAAAGRQRRRAALRPDGDAAVLRLQHGRLLRPLARDRPARGRQAAAGSSTSTGSARTTTASSCGPASARTPACWRGSSAAARARPRRSRPPIGLVPPLGEGGIDTDRARHHRRGDGASCSRSTPRRG